MFAVRRAALSVLLITVVCALSAGLAQARHATTKAQYRTSARAQQRASTKALQMQRATVPERQELVASASPTTGNILTFSARLAANFQTSDGEPVSGLRITFLTAQGIGGGQPLCNGVTDPEGDALCTASFTGNLFQPISGFLSGYDAIFKGNSLYAPATAHSTATPGP